MTCTPPPLWGGKAREVLCVNALWEKASRRPEALPGQRGDICPQEKKLTDPSVGAGFDVLCYERLHWCGQIFSFRDLRTMAFLCIRRIVPIDWFLPFECTGIYYVCTLLHAIFGNY